ncbi:hypothetical protein CEXT_40011 [Caerostris extrusa]|uniref:Uncharacterized protein n=1 Tax=Caerostris extrusa TaxID=172846 RepID=A0AAV4MQ71_CAEEX|nr:hypothetical protein CEXT_40011 [Caerostris extrusa]
MDMYLPLFVLNGPRPLYDRGCGKEEGMEGKSVRRLSDTPFFLSGGALGADRLRLSKSHFTSYRSQKEERAFIQTSDREINTFFLCIHGVSSKAGIKKSRGLQEIEEHIFMKGLLPGGHPIGRFLTRGVFKELWRRAEKRLKKYKYTRGDASMNTRSSYWEASSRIDGA